MQNLKNVLYFHENSGNFFWKKDLQPAGVIDNKGYLKIYYQRKCYLAHRLAWFFYTGQTPKDQIDHINNNKQDNRLENLRECTNQQNHFNRPLNKNNTSGYKGVVFCKTTNRWRASLMLNGKRISIGRYDSKEQAASAYDWKATEVFGEFANPNGDVWLLS